MNQQTFTSTIAPSSGRKVNSVKSAQTGSWQVGSWKQRLLFPVFQIKKTRFRVIERYEIHQCRLFMTANKEYLC